MWFTKRTIQTVDYRYCSSKTMEKKKPNKNHMNSIKRQDNVQSEKNFDL